MDTDVPVVRAKGFIFECPPFPPPFLQCHGSTLARLPDGRYVAAWFAGTREMHVDTAIWMSYQDGNGWKKPFKAFKVNDSAHWNPVLRLGPSGLALHFKTGRFPDVWDTWVVNIDEHGKSKKPPRMLKPKMLSCGKATPGPVRNKTVELSNGTLIAPSSIEKVFRDMYPYEVEWSSVFHVSKNGGKSWRTTKVVEYNRKVYGERGGIIQPAVWESSPGVASALFRSTTGFLFRSDSDDGGMHWSPAVQTSIPNPNSAIDLSTRDGVLAMVYNPISGNWAKRSNLSIAFSGLDGESFGEPVPLSSGMGTYSYPAMVATDFGFAVTYTWSRKRIAFVEVVVNGDLRAPGTPPIELRSDIVSYQWQNTEQVFG